MYKMAPREVLTRKEVRTQIRSVEKEEGKV